MSWIDDFLAQADDRRRTTRINRAAHYIYPTPVWAGGMDDLPRAGPDTWGRDRPRTARGYAEAVVDIIAAA